MEKAEKAELQEKARNICGGDGIKALMELIDVLIEECHKDNESNMGDYFMRTQGEIKGFRKLQKIFQKSKKA